MQLARKLAQQCKRDTMRDTVRCLLCCCTYKGVDDEGKQLVDLGLRRRVRSVSELCAHAENLPVMRTSNCTRTWKA